MSIDALLTLTGLLKPFGNILPEIAPEDYDLNDYKKALDEIYDTLEHNREKLDEDHYKNRLSFAGSMGQAIATQKKRLKIGFALRAMAALADQYDMTITLAKHLSPDFLTEPNHDDRDHKPRKGLTQKHLVRVCGTPGRTAADKIPAADVAEEIRTTEHYKGLLSVCHANVVLANRYRQEKAVENHERAEQVRQNKLTDKSTIN